MIAAIRVRGPAKSKGDTKDTLEMLHLSKPNNCSLIPETETADGMLQKGKDYITWGEVKPDVLEKMLAKWGRVNGGRLTDDYLKTKKTTMKKVTEELISGKTSLKALGIKQPIRLHPPRQGYEGVKRPYSMKGALGYRGDAINELLTRMI